ncbi:MAG: STAS/SEC14 domain-containing protein [Polyangia bacterium]
MTVTSQMVGKHTMTIEEDIVFLTMDGDMDLENAQTFHEQIEKVLTRLKRVFVLVDMTRARNTTPDARRFVAEWNRKHRASGAAIFGGSVTQRAAAALTFAAIRIFRPSLLPIATLKTEAEARAWISEQRTKLLTPAS